MMLYLKKSSRGATGASARSVFWAAMLLLMFAVPQVMAQAEILTAPYGGEPYQRLARPGEATQKVMLLSDLGVQGVYTVGKSIPLGEFIVMTGAVATLPEERGERQEVTVRLLREEAGERVTVYKRTLEELLAAPQEQPVMRDGDVLRVDVVVQKRRLSWRDGLTLLQTAGTLTLLAWRFVR